MEMMVAKSVSRRERRGTRGWKRCQGKPFAISMKRVRELWHRRQMLNGWKDIRAFF